MESFLLAFNFILIEQTYFYLESDVSLIQFILPTIQEALGIVEQRNTTEFGTAQKTETQQRKIVQDIVINECRSKFIELKNDQTKKYLFCYVDKKFRKQRLTDKKGNEIKCEEYASNLRQLDKLGKGGQSVGAVKRYKDNNDIHYGGDIAMKRVRATTDQDRNRAYRELYTLQIINKIPNRKHFFVQLRCCFFEKGIDTKSNQEEIYLVFIFEFGRCTLKNLIKSKRKFSNFELLTMLLNIVQGGAHLEEHNISQRDYKPSNIILNSQYKQVKVIDFGIALFLSRKKNMLKKLDDIGTVQYMSPQNLAMHVANLPEKEFKNDQMKLCKQYAEKQYLLQDGKYSPCKSDVYSIAIMFCELAGMERDQMMWCFQSRSEEQKRKKLQTHFKDCQELAYILYNMLFNAEAMRWSFHTVLQETKCAIESLNKNGIVVHPTLNEEEQKRLLRAEQFTLKDEDELKKSNQANFDHFHQKFSHNFKAGLFDDALFNIDKCIHYTDQEVYHQCYKHKSQAMYRKGKCLIQLSRPQCAYLVLQQLLAFLNSDIKDEWVHDGQDEFHLQQGKCLELLGYANYLVGNDEDGLIFCEQSLVALHFNNQQSNTPNQKIISYVYNVQSGIYQNKKDFSKAREKMDMAYKINEKINNIDGQAAYFNNICLLKMQQHEFDKDALQFVDNAMMLYGQDNQGQNYIEQVKCLFYKCMILCVLENAPNLTQQQQSDQGQSQQQQQLQQEQLQFEQIYNQFLETAKGNVGGGTINKPYADYIKKSGLICFKDAREMKSIALMKLAIRLLKVAMQAYNSIKDQEEEKKVLELVQQIKMLRTLSSISNQFL